MRAGEMVIGEWAHDGRAGVKVLEPVKWPW
ncbi:hypothetical protein HNP84_007170 [Thermocatellispora tengchongensis]|uniref:Uncharacterized protein n=1 Tax=Thermocatellispora tengchongensis TaxID=1073253 RepID=A0A840PCS4_9ACTN|nr:hypothetical protein [Thermocatellispora tengchongensis]